MSIRRTAALLGLTLALLTAGAAGTGAATAEAATAKLSITATGYYNQYRVNVWGELAGDYPYGFDYAIRLWGEDQWYDDLVAGSFTNYWPQQGRYYAHEFYVYGNKLNEDWEGRDELYAGVRIYDHRTGSQRESAESNRIYGWY